MENIALFAGSFCPFTKGHEDIVRKALPLFDKVIIAIGHNFKKKDLFSVEQLIEWIQGIYNNEPKVSVVAYQGLTVDFCKSQGARYLIRGLRNANDYAMEEEIRQINRMLAPDIETIIIPTAQEFAHISSSAVRDIIKHGGDTSAFLPEGIRL